MWLVQTDLLRLSSFSFLTCLMAMKIKLSSVYSMLWTNHHNEMNKQQEKHTFIINQYGKEKLWNYFSLLRLHFLHNTQRGVPHGINDSLSFAVCNRVKRAMGQKGWEKGSERKRSLLIKTNQSACTQQISWWSNSMYRHHHPHTVHDTFICCWRSTIVFHSHFTSTAGFCAVGF